MKKKKNPTLLILLAVILASLAFIIFGDRAMPLAEEEEEEETTVREVVEKPCSVNEHYKVYLGIGEVYVLDDIGYVSEDETIASVKTNRVTGNSVGKTLLVKDCNTYEVEVTDMILAPHIDPNKPLITCGQYTEEDNAYLDEILRTKIAERGYKTRAAVVQAARFLTLQFPYHMNYYNENGRLPYCDGEGRYYHEGLYLNKTKAADLTRSVRGPQPWGCPLYSIPYGNSLRNSLDCSGFVSWAIVNGGFDPGDLGAGPMPNVVDLTDLGERHKITEESLDEVKNGDLFSAPGHIAILIGIKDDIYYIAESNVTIDVRAKGWTKEELIASSFNQWVDMDEFYGHNDGKMNQYWE